MDSDIKLNLEKWELTLDDEIKYIVSLESNYTYILTPTFFYIYDKSKDELIKHQIPNNKDENLDSIKNDTSMENRIWPDKFGIHIIFKLEGICYYYNNILKENKKIKRLELIFEENKKYIEPIALSFNDINKNKKNSDEIIFTDINSTIYTLNIKIDLKGEISEKIEKIFDIRNIKNFDLENIDKTKEEEKEKDELDNYLEENYFILEKDDIISDIKLIIKEDESKKSKTTKNYFILAVSKRILFQFEGKNSISEIFSKNKNDNTDKISIKNLIENCKIFPKMNNISLENPKIQLYKSKDKKIIFSWNNEIGFTFWEMPTDKTDNSTLIQKEFNLYRYIKIKEDGNLEKNPCPLSCVSTSRNIYFLYSDCLMIINTLTKNITYTKYFKDKDKYLDMFFNPDMNKIILYSSNSIIKLSLDHEYNNLWEDYIQTGDYDLAIQLYQKDDEDFKKRLRKLKANFLFNKKDYESAGFEFALSDENFEHVCIKFFKLNDVNSLINYLNLVNKLRLAKIEEKKSESNEDIFLIQKYLINTWIMELILEKIEKNNNNDGDDKTDFIKIPNNKIKDIINRSGYIDSKKYLDKLIIFYFLRNYGKHKDFVEFAGLKNDYMAIIFDLLNHNKCKDAINNLINYMSYDNDIIYLKKLIKIFLMYINIFVKESPEKVIEILDQYYYLIENPKDIIRIIINMDDIYSNKMSEETFEKVLGFIKKILFFYKKSKKGIEYNSNLDGPTKHNLYNLYILYLSKSPKLEHLNELNDYLKSLIVFTKKQKDKFSLIKNQNQKQIFFEFSFAENLFKENISSLALLYCLKKQYNKSISYAVKCKDKSIPIFIANSISDPKKKKEIWLSIFNYSKSSEMKKIEEILEQSKGVLTIIDILPYLMGNVQLKEILTNLNKFIDDYEIKLRKLKINIKDFAKSEEIINKKISRISNYAQKNLRVKLEEINCCICLKNLKENNFYLFPCRHAFDFDCIINLLLYYDNKKIGDENFKKRINSIKNILNALQKAKKFKDEIDNSDKKLYLNFETRIKNQNTFKGFFKNLTFKNEIKDINLESETELIDSSIDELDELLNAECPLCGNEIILDVQTKFGEEDDMEWTV